MTFRAMLAPRVASFRAATTSARLDGSRARLVRSLALPAAFVLGNVVWLGPMLNLGTLGADARLYHTAATAWLAGLDPWGLADPGPYHFSGLPPTLLVVAPFTVLSGGAFAVLGVVLSAIAAFWTIRRLGLPLWWLAFPPLLGGVWFGNPDIVLLALLLGPAACLAPLLKVYAFVPLILRPRALLVALALFGVSVVLAPGLWLDYLANATRIGSRLVIEAHGGFSGWAVPPLLLVGAVGLAVLAWRRDSAVAWLVVPVLWPGTEFHYATMVLPVVSPELALLASVPLPGLIALAPWLRLRFRPSE